MRVGLIRHFKVLQSYRNFEWVTSAKYQEWQDKYDTAEIITSELDLSRDVWDICFSSDLPRAVKTAKHIYKKDIIQTELLREITISSATKKNIKLPFVMWNILGRLAWYFNHKSQKEGRKKTWKRVKDFISHISALKETNILVVSHGALMWLLRKELVKNGFHGERFLSVPNGRLYVYRKK